MDGFTITQDAVTGFYQFAGITEARQALVSTGVRTGMVDPKGLGLKKSLRIGQAAAKARALEKRGLPRGRSRWESRREQAKMASHAAMLRGVASAPPRWQTTDSYIGLCLPIQSPDISGTITKEEVEKFCSKKGYKGFGNNGSVHDYFLEMSAGKLQYTNIIVPYYKAKHPRAYYTDEKVARPGRARELIKKSLENLKKIGFDNAIGDKRLRKKIEKLKQGTLRV